MNNYKLFWPHTGDEVWFSALDQAMYWAKQWARNEYALVLVWSKPGAFYIGRFDGRVK